MADNKSKFRGRIPSEFLNEPNYAGRGTCSYCKRRKIDLWWTTEGLGRCRITGCKTAK